MGSLFDVVDAAFNPKTVVPDWMKPETTCLNQANQSQTIMEIDAEVDNLARNWNPTGFYTAADIQTVWKSTTDAIVGARAALLGSILSTGDAAQQVKQAQDYLDRATTRGALYPAAIANAKGTIINAPGLKQWVLETLVNVGQAYTTVAVLQCRSSWLDTAAAVIAAVVNVVKRVIGIVIKAGDTVLKLADDALDLVPILKWGALAVGGFLVFNALRKHVAQ